jgi:CMP-N,N'-diacetyllegionaminic acid synthase
MKIVAVILARAGSKSIPAKNIKDFAGKPLIAWSILSALESSEVDRVIVSTDSPQIAEVAKSFGAEVPFLRPAELASDSMGVEPVLKHAYEWLRYNEGYEADALILLPPTTPTRQSHHIDDMVRIFKSTNTDSVVAVNETPANHTPYWTLVRRESGGVTLFGGQELKYIMTRRQDFPQKCFARNDLGYVLRPQNLYEDIPNLYGNNVELYIVTDALKYEIDINTPEEWIDAERKMQKLINDNKNNMIQQQFDIGILQGRLSPDTDKRFQFFPRDWRLEFELAKACGFSGIEWIVDPKVAGGWQNNPIFYANTEIERVSNETGTPVLSICADWFMDVCIWEGDPEEHREMLRKLIVPASKTKNRIILVPLLETHAIIDPMLQERVVDILRPLASELESAGVSVAFETELPAEQLASFIDSFKSSSFGVYYDTGNCTSYGFDCVEDINFLRHRIKGVHIKDRKRHTTQTVSLGEGDTDFQGIFKALRDVGWQGTLVMQAWRGEEYTADALRQFDFLRHIGKDGDAISVDTNSTFNISGSSVIVTGAAGFLGRGYVRALLSAGAKVFAWDRNIDGLKELDRDVDDILKQNLKTTAIDLTNENSVMEEVNRIVKEGGRIDGLVNNAAMNPAVGSEEAKKQFVPYEEYPIEMFRKEMDANLTSMMITMKCVAPQMIKQRSGSIVNIASEVSVIAHDHRVYGEVGKYKSPAYIASKTAVVGLTRQWAARLGECNVRVNAVSIGGTYKDGMPMEFVNRFGATNMFGRMAKEGEYIPTVQYLLSDASSFMTGSNLIIDGGKHAW